MDGPTEQERFWELRGDLKRSEFEISLQAERLAGASQVLAISGAVAASMFVPLALLSTGIWAVVFIVGVGLGILAICGAFVVRRAATRHELLDQQLLRLRACGVPSMWQSTSSGSSLGGAQWGEYASFIAYEAGHLARHRLGEYALRSRTKLRIRRLTAGAAALVDAAPETARGVEIPALNDLASSVERQLGRLEQATDELSAAAVSLDEGATSGIDATVRSALAEALIGPADVLFDGWESFSIVGDDGANRLVDDATVRFAAGERLSLLIEISERLGDADAIHSIPLAARGTRTPDLIDFRIDVRGIGVDVEERSRTIQWQRSVGSAATEFILSARSQGAEVYVTTYLGPRLMQSKRFRLEVPLNGDVAGAQELEL